MHLSWRRVMLVTTQSNAVYMLPARLNKPFFVISTNLTVVAVLCIKCS